MFETFYSRIREENIGKYGTQVRVYGPVLLANLYSDRTHFIYEILQNAEDACERARKNGFMKRFFVRFSLFLDRLEVRHNGIPFDENDVRGICGIVEAIKDKNIAQIGKFGIGFKSVYAYTNCPEIHSGDKFFSIRDYVYPYSIEASKDLNPEETLLVIRFNEEGEKRKQAHLEIENRLKRLGIRTLLFLKNLEEISYNIGSINGNYMKSYETKMGVKTVALKYIEDSQEKNRENWIIFDRYLSRDPTRRLEIGYQLVFDATVKKWKIGPANDVKLFVYLPTEKETHLKFLIQGPFNTTPARDNIRDDNWNRDLIADSAKFAAESILKVKDLGLLNAEFLNTLPIETDYFTSQVTAFRPVYESIREKLSSEALLPAIDGSFATVDQAFIARGKELRSLLSGEQLDLLFDRKNSRWLDENITEVRTPELYNYLIEVLRVNELYPEAFARAFNEEFIKIQNDQWVISFYTFLLSQKALWTKPFYYYDKPGILRTKPIIRLQNNSHVVPFDDNGHQNAYLPHKDPTVSTMFANVVKEIITNDKRAREFLQNLDVTEPNQIDGVLELILPKYNNEETTVSEKQNIQHVSWILKTLEEKDCSRRDELLEKLADTPFLFAENAVDRREEYRKPFEIHLGEAYTGNGNLEIFFQGNQDIWFLQERYLILENGGKLIDRFKQIGCKSGIVAKYRKPNYLGYVIITDYFAYHKRGFDGFDPDCEIEGLEFALQNINIERARLLWQVTKECCRCIYGEVESCTRQNYEGSERTKQYSKIGKLLVEYAWLPDSKNVAFHKPSEIMIIDLPDDFDKESTQAKYVSEKLGMKPVVAEEIRAMLEKTPEEAREIVEIFISAAPETQQRILDTVRIIRRSEGKLEETTNPDETTTTLIVSPSVNELETEFQQALMQDRQPTADFEDRTWTGPTPEQEEKMRQFEDETLGELSKRTQTIYKERKEASLIRTEGEKETELKQFLLEQYKGYCQVCNTRLDLGGGKDPYFEIYRIIEKRRKVGAWSDLEFNVLCLCPNCHALMKYGGRDLAHLFDKANLAAKGEAAPEEAKERGGDFYIIPITVAEEEKDLFLAPLHMAKLSAFVKMLASNL